MALGRIDADELSRTGYQTLIAATVFLPLMLLVGRGPAEAGRAGVGLALLAGLLAPPGEALIAARVAGQAVAIHQLPDDFPLVAGRELGLPNVGLVAGDPELLDEIVELKRALDPLLGPGETYLDLTNRSAYYYYLDRPVPALYAANYVAATAGIQGRMLDQLREHRPRVVLIGPAVVLDMAPASLRSYLLYREFATRYVTIRRGRFTLLVDPALAPEAGPPGGPEQLALLDEAFPVGELHRLPASWGHSAAALAPGFRVVAAVGPGRLGPVAGAVAGPRGTFTPTGPETELAYRIDDLGLDGRDADFLALDFDYVRTPGSPAARVEVGWDADGHRIDAALRFEAARSTLLVPLGRTRAGS